MSLLGRSFFFFLSTAVASANGGGGASRVVSINTVSCPLIAIVIIGIIVFVEFAAVCANAAATVLPVARQKKRVGNTAAVTAVAALLLPIG